ncbi:MAG: hypothetical protein VX948_18375 [Candidatus Latescibacterota bacterium]|nr:hypothetical protein [Candidatus Latescibacterota bacterium]
MGRTVCLQLRRALWSQLPQLQSPLRAKVEDNVVEWQAQLALPDTDDDRTIAFAVRDSLGLLGWAPWWEYRHRDDVFHFQVVRPGKRYQMHLSTDGSLQVEEYRLGIWPVVNQLHALMSLPNSEFMSWWGAFTELTFWVVLLSAGSGVCLWTRLSAERRIGWILLGVTAATLPLMGYIYVIG